MRWSNADIGYRKEAIGENCKIYLHRLIIIYRTFKFDFRLFALWWFKFAGDDLNLKSTWVNLENPLDGV